MEYKVYSDHLEFGIKRTPKTPFVWFLENGEVYFIGKSIPEDGGEYFCMISDWLEEMNGEDRPQLQISINMEFLNGSSSKLLLQLLRQMKNRFTNLWITWHFHKDQPDIYELGHLFSLSLDIPIIFKENTS